MISPNLEDKLGATGPKPKYLLSTCSGTTEEKSVRRVCGVVLHSMAGRTIRLPQLVECPNIPRDKHEIITPEMAMQFSHLKEVPKEIPLTMDPQAKVEIRIGRDTPELLKVRESRNGPKGAPWAQRLDLGWTISGQMCLDRVGGPIHISVRRTAVEYPDKLLALHFCSSTKHKVVPCPNHFKVKEKYAEREEIADVFRTTPEDNMPSMTQDERSFMQIMNAGTRKNH